MPGRWPDRDVHIHICIRVVGGRGAVRQWSCFKEIEAFGKFSYFYDKPYRHTYCNTFSCA